MAIMAMSYWYEQEQMDKAMLQIMQMAQQERALNQQGLANMGTLGAGSTGGSGGGGGAYCPTHLHTNAGTGTTSIPNQQYTGVHLPSPTGSHVPIRFLDATGNMVDMVIDSAYIHIFSAISNTHYLMPKATVAPKMPQGDFSEDEMVVAEKIIEELEAGHARAA